MARPQKEGLDYFPHDTDASSDEKTEALRALYGNDGYAFYFILLERIYRTPNFEIDISDTETIQILARKTAVTPEKFNQMLATALKWGCFDREAYENRHVLTSQGIKKRASVVVKKREEMRKKYHIAKIDISESETIQETKPETPQSKEKKSKDINNNPPLSPQADKKPEKPKRKYADNVLMTEEEHQKLIDKFGEFDTRRIIEILDNYKGAHGKRYKSDYRAILTWVVGRLEEEKRKGGQSYGREPTPTDILAYKQNSYLKRAREANVQ